MSKKNPEKNRENRENQRRDPTQWQAFIVSSNESTGMIPAIFVDDSIDSYDPLFQGMDTFPALDNVEDERR